MRVAFLVKALLRLPWPPAVKTLSQMAAPPAPQSGFWLNVAQSKHQLGSGGRRGQRVQSLVLLLQGCHRLCPPWMKAALLWVKGVAAPSLASEGTERPTFVTLAKVFWSYSNLSDVLPATTWLIHLPSLTPLSEHSPSACKKKYPFTRHFPEFEYHYLETFCSNLKGAFMSWRILEFYL